MLSIHTPLCSGGTKTLHTCLCCPILFQPDCRHRRSYERKRKKKCWLCKKGVLSVCLLPGNNLIPVPGAICLHAGSRTWWRRRAIGTGSLQITRVQDVLRPSPDSLQNLDAKSHRHRCRTPVASFTSLALDDLVKAEAESNYTCKHLNPHYQQASPWNDFSHPGFTSLFHPGFISPPLTQGSTMKCSQVLVTSTSRSLP